MVLGTRIALTASMVSLAVCSLAPSAGAQQARVGVVTNVEGPATVARVALPQPQQLRFKDDVFLKDRITTGDRAIVRMLLGGKATVTARERSVLTITEAPGVSRVELTSGRIAVAVSKAQMKPGEIVEIRTPNAVTAVRGTVVIAEVWPGATVRSAITVLRGLVDVTRLDTGTRQPVGPAVDVSVRQTITVVGASPLSRPTGISADDANRLTAEFRMLPSTAPAASTAPAVQTAVQRAAVDAEALVSASTAAVGAGSTIGSSGTSGNNAVAGSNERTDNAASSTSGSSATSGDSSGRENNNSGKGSTSGGASVNISVTTPSGTVSSGKGAVGGVSGGTTVSGQGASTNLVVRPPVPVVPPVNTTINVGTPTKK